MSGGPGPRRSRGSREDKRKFIERTSPSPILVRKVSRTCISESESESESSQGRRNYPSARRRRAGVGDDISAQVYDNDKIGDLVEA